MNSNQVSKLELLRRRDKFLEELSKEISIQQDGLDIVAEVSLDAESILQNLKSF